jgi:hypothetical protein
VRDSLNALMLKSNYFVSFLLLFILLLFFYFKRQDYTIQNEEDALKVYFETDQYKISDTPTDQRVPLEIDTIVTDVNESHKNETINLKHKKLQDKSSDQIFNNNNNNKATKKKCSDPIFDYDYVQKAKKQRKVSETIKPSKVKK